MIMVPLESEREVFISVEVVLNMWWELGLEKIGLVLGVVVAVIAPTRAMSAAAVSIVTVFLATDIVEFCSAVATVFC